MQTLQIMSPKPSTETEQDPVLLSYAASAKLAQRYYCIKESGGQTIYWDSEEGHTTLTAMHLHETLASYGVHETTGKTFAATCKNIIDNTQFKPIILEPVYRPYGPRVIKKNSHWHPNSWSAPLVKPDTSVSAKPFVEHLTRMLGTEDKADYLIDMLAYRFQSKSNVKPHVAFYLYGGQGFGKGIFSSTIAAVFGETAVRTVTDQNSLKSMSGVDVWTRTWAIVDEVDVKAGSSCYNNIKTMTGGQSFDSARKGEHFKRYETPAQLIMNSNHAPTFLEADDRRFFVSKWETEFKPYEDKTRYFKDYVNWLELQGGYEAIAGLLSERDVSGVEISAHAMMTQEKLQVTALMTDEVTCDISTMLEEFADVNVFDASMFDSIWSKYVVPQNQQKYKLLEAGLNATAHKAYEGKRRTLWIRKGFTLMASKGVAPVLLNDKVRTQVHLKSDLGYQHSVHAKHIEGWFKAGNF